MTKGRARLAPGTLARRVLVTLDQATVDKARALGEGNLSRGVRMAVRKVRLTSQGIAPNVTVSKL